MEVAGSFFWVRPTEGKPFQTAPPDLSGLMPIQIPYRGTFLNFLNRSLLCGFWRPIAQQLGEEADLYPSLEP